MKWLIVMAFTTIDVPSHSSSPLLQNITSQNTFWVVEKHMEAHLPRDNKSQRNGSSFEAPAAAVAIQYNEALVHQMRQSRR